MVDFGINIDSNGLISNLKNLLVGFKNNLETNASSMSAKIETCFNNWSVNENNFKKNLYKITPNVDYSKYSANTSSLKSFSQSLAKGIAKENEKKKEEIAIKNHPLANRDVPLDLKSFADMSKADIKTALEERLSMMGLSSDLNSKAKQCIVGGKAVTTDSAKPYIEIATDAVYEASRGLEQEGEQEQKQEESAEESEKTSQMSDKEKEKKKEKEEQKEFIFNEEQLKNIEKYGIKAENIQDYEDAMKELADMGLLKDDPETQKEDVFALYLL